ncbi:hypothetical protein AMEX_G26480 [Astyanax mexicanus]|uniref:Uncharacterized protein n=1 Tax=Astyanax mexicanus TaxID=7994 RepID=A0A8T2KTD3_ASTMX|nr:hypothetical protein AMEX_G26480 [Astyanax mexicanus]
MDGVLEAAVALCGCKVVCSFLCLPAFSRSISSVSLCCCCLLLFTDLSITVFMSYLWCAAPNPLSFHPSSDTIALRFLLFLSKTYEAVLILTPILVAVEVILWLLWHQEATMSENTIGEIVKKKNKHSEMDPLVLLMDAEEKALEMEPVQREKRITQENRGMFFTFLKVVSFFGCLLLWCISGTYAGSSWKQDQPMVKECLEKGGSLSACLPCLLTASSPIGGQLLWLLAAILVVLGLIQGLKGLHFSKPVQFLELIFHTNQQEMSQKTVSVSGLHLQMFFKWVKEYKGSESNRNQQKQWNFVLDLTTEHKDGVDSATQGLQLEYNGPPLANGNPRPLCGQTGLTGCCKLQSGDVLPASQQQSAAELPLTGTDVLGNTGPALNPIETRHWKPQWESPCLSGGLMTGLVCGLLVCVFPTVLSTNILLVRSLDMLVVCVVKHLLIANHSK